MSVMRFLRDERGSAMTEFVIGLPVFVLIFSGLGALHKLNNEALIARMKTIRALSFETTAVNNMEDFVATNVDTGGSINVGSFLDINIPGSGSDGIYIDSGKKATLGSQFGTIKNPAAPPKSSIEEITGGENNFVNNLLDDGHEPIQNPQGWVQIVRGIVRLAGVNPSIGAGIRYIPIEAEESRTFEHPWVGSMTYNPGRVDLPAPTAATHRVFPVLLARLEMSSKEPYTGALLEFDLSVKTSDMISGGSLPPGMNEEMIEECQEEAAIYTDCLQDPAVEAEASSQTCWDGVIPRDCTVVDLCESFEPSGDCQSAADGATNAGIFDSPQCDAQGECARPTRSQASQENTDANDLTLQEYP